MINKYPTRDVSTNLIRGGVNCEGGQHYPVILHFIPPKQKVVLFRGELNVALCMIFIVLFQQR